MSEQRNRGDGGGCDLVFISHAAEDQEIADRVAECVRTGGQEAWLASRSENDGNSFVGDINAALARAAAVLVLWSASAVNSRWVRREHESSLARVLSGETLRVLLVCLDDTPVPPLDRGQQVVRLRDFDSVQDSIRSILPDSDLRVPNDLADRVARHEFRREGVLREVESNLIAGNHVVLYAPRRSGRATVARQLSRRMEEQAPRWEVRTIFAREQDGESLDHYRARMQGACRPGGEQTVLALVHGWEKAQKTHQDALGRLLRSEAETASGKLLVVAIGGHPVYLQRNLGSSDWSLLNSANPVFLDDIDEISLLDGMRELWTGWSAEDARAVLRYSGGHPDLVKRLLSAWAHCRDGGWQHIAGILESDESFLIPAVAALNGPNWRPEDRQAAQRVLHQLLEHPDEGLKWPRTQPGSVLVRLYFDGLLKRRAGALHLRCSAVVNLIREFLGEKRRTH